MFILIKYKFTVTYSYTISAVVNKSQLFSVAYLQTQHLEIKMFLLRSRQLIKPEIIKFNLQASRNLQYIQGQSPEPKIREYFYYIDHEGMVSVAIENIIDCNYRIMFLSSFWTMPK